jgi:hypothetical protein
MCITELSVTGLKTWVAHLKMQNKNGNNISGGKSMKFKEAQLHEEEIMM